MAKLDGKTLHISGLDIGWKEIELNTEQIGPENNRILDQIVAVTLMQSMNVPESDTKAYLFVVALHQRTYEGKLPLTQRVFGAGEILWLSSVLSAVVPKMK